MGRWPLCESRGLEIRLRGLSSGPPWPPSPHTDTQATTVLCPEPQGEQTSPHASVQQALPFPYNSLSDDACHPLLCQQGPEGDSGQAPNLLGDGSKCLPGFSGKQTPSWD